MLLTAVAGLLGCANTHSGEERADHLVRSSACQGRWMPASFAESRLLYGAPPALCDAVAADCDAFFACRGIVRDPPPCAADAPAVGCDGSYVEVCPEAGFRARTDCAVGEPLNPECVVDAEGLPRCTSGDPCPGDATRCDGGQLITCHGGVSRRLDCEHRSCTTAGDIGACVDDTLPCDRSRCEGTTLVDCLTGLGSRRHDCASVVRDGRCELDTEGEPECVGPNDDCEDGETRCVGDVAQACAGSTWIEYRCGDFQGASCESDGARWRCVLPSE